MCVTPVLAPMPGIHRPNLKHVLSIMHPVLVPHTSARDGPDHAARQGNPDHHIPTGTPAVPDKPPPPPPPPSACPPAPKCVSMSGMSPWRLQLDTFAMHGILHKYPTVWIWDAGQQQGLLLANIPAQRLRVDAGCIHGHVMQVCPSLVHLQVPWHAATQQDNVLLTFQSAQGVAAASPYCKDWFLGATHLQEGQLKLAGHKSDWGDGCNHITA